MKDAYVFSWATWKNHCGKSVTNVIIILTQKEKQRDFYTNFTLKNQITTHMG